MQEEPDIASVAALVGDPARARMLTALSDGYARTAIELATDAGVTAQTASSHLRKLLDGGLVAKRKQGRHHYYQLAGPDVADLLARLELLANKRTRPTRQFGPKDPDLRYARSCYGHLAGDLGILMFDGMTKRGLLREHDDDLELTRKGEDFVVDFGIDLAALAAKRRPLCRLCLDWSNRRSHLAGALGVAFLTRICELRWANRKDGDRAVRFNPSGERQFRDLFEA